MKFQNYQDSDNIFTNVVLPAPDGEDKIIITPSFSEGIKNY
jgi:hypothetical protein